MYQRYYGFQKPPFSLLPDPEFFFLGGPSESTLAALEYGLLAHKGLILLTGEPGLGKTTLLRKIIREKGIGARVGEISNTNSCWESVMPWVALAFELDTPSSIPGKNHVSLIRFLNHSSHKENPALLIIDEAQNLSPSMLEELRLLSNVNNDGMPKLQIIFSGQPHIRALLQKPELTQLAQRIEIDCHLQPLNRQMTHRYIRHRLQCAGGSSQMFTEQACSLVYDLSGGVPRLINQLCDLGLAYGFAEHIHVISDYVIAEVGRDRLEGGVLPIQRSQQITDILSRGPSPQESILHDRKPEPGSPLIVTDSHGSIESSPSHQKENGHVRAIAVSPPSQEVLSVPTSEVVSEESGSIAPQRLLEYAMALQKKGKYKTAIQLLALAAKHEPLQSRAHFEIAVCLVALGKSQSAIAYFQKVLASDRDVEQSLSARYELGKIFYRSGKMSNAREHFQWLYEQNPKYRDVEKWLQKFSRDSHHGQHQSAKGDARTMFWEGLKKRSLAFRVQKNETMRNQNGTQGFRKISHDQSHGQQQAAKRKPRSPIWERLKQVLRISG